MAVVSAGTQNLTVSMTTPTSHINVPIAAAHNLITTKPQQQQQQQQQQQGMHARLPGNVSGNDIIRMLLSIAPLILLSIHSGPSLQLFEICEVLFILRRVFRATYKIIIHLEICNSLFGNRLIALLV